MLLLQMLLPSGVIISPPVRGAAVHETAEPLWAWLPTAQAAERETGGGIQPERRCVRLPQVRAQRLAGALDRGR